MASILGALLKILRILRSSAKDHIKRLLRLCWAPLLAYLSRKLNEWRCSWLSNPGTHRKPKPADPSFPFPGGRGGSCSVSCSSARGHAARVAASTVPASANAANRPHRELEGAERWQVEPETAPPSPSPSILDTLPVPRPNLDWEIQWPGIGEQSPTDHRSRGQSIQSAGDHDRSSISRTSSRASSQNDRPSSRALSPRSTYRQFGPGPGASQSRRRSSKSPSPQPSLNTAQPHHFGPVPTSTNIHAHADGMSPTISPQSFAGSPSPLSHTREQLSPPASRRSTQRRTSIGLNIQSPSTESLPSAPLIYPLELTEEPMSIESPTRSSSPISLVDGLETASQHSQRTSSAPPDYKLPEGCSVYPINTGEIPRYTKNITMQVYYFS